MTARKHFFSTITILISTLMLTSFSRDPDFGWHFKYGEYLSTHGRLLTDNIYSFTLPNYEWANSYWISQIFLYLSYSKLGLVAGSIPFALVFSIWLYFFVTRFTKDQSVIFISIVFTSALVELFNITARPLFFSSIFYMAEILILLKYPKKLWLLPPIFLVWANTHADFVPALIIFAGYIFARLPIVENLSDRFREKFDKGLNFPPADFEISDTNKSPLLLQILILLLCVAVTFINPFGADLHKTLLLETHPLQFRIIGEWRPIKPESISLPIMFWAVTLPAVWFLYLKNKIQLWMLGLIFALTLFSTRSVYFLRFAVLIGPVFATLFWAWVVKTCAPLAPKHISQPFRVLKPLSYSILGLALIFLLAQNAIDFANTDKAFVRNEYPVDAAKFIKAKNYQGNMFNNYGWGGYLIYAMPEHKTFIDGRMASWRNSDEHILDSYMKVQTDKKLLEEYILKYNLTFALLKVDEFTELIKNLTELGWSTEYKDSVAVVLASPK